MKRALAVAAPPPDLTVSAWADRNRRLSSEASAEPGRWSTDRAAYQRGIMDAVSDPAVETVVVMTAAQVGKALAVDTSIPTPDGWTTMGDVRVGDRVFDEMGRPCRVIFATGVMVARPCYRVVFSDGSSLIADADHLWAVQSDTIVDIGRTPDDTLPRHPHHPGDRRHLQMGHQTE